MSVDPNWFDGFFENEWLDELALRTPEEKTFQQVGFVVEQLGLEPGTRILDVACGHGRHSIELARRGFRVTGVDLSPRSIELATARAQREGIDATFVRLDMRELEFDGEFDGAINLFTAFGYFDEEADNQRALDRIARALVPGGVFLIDTINLLNLAKRFRARDWEQHEGSVLLMEHTFDYLRGRNLALWTFIRDDGSRSELRHSLRTYAPHELARMFETAGLQVDGSWGSFDGDELSFDTWRLILRGRKAKSSAAREP